MDPPIPRGSRGGDQRCGRRGRLPGIVQDSLERVLRPGAAALVLQASVYASLHFPSGILQGFAGAGLALFYGLVLGLLRRRSGGLGAPVIAHTVTDLVIVGIVLAQSVE